METIKQYGSNCATPVSVEGYPRRVLSNGEWTYEEQFHVNAANVNTYIPAKNSTNSMGYLLREVEITYREAGGFPNVCLVRIVWGESSYAGGGGGGGSSISRLSYDSNSAIVEHDISEHPVYAQATEAQKELLKANLPKYAVHTVQFNRTERKAKSTWHPTMAEIVGTVGTKEAPTGISDATAATWLHTGRRITWTKSDLLEVTDEWTYDAYGWQGLIGVTTTLAELVALAKAR